MIIRKETIRRIRKKLNLTQVQFAKRVGVTSITVSRWERGHQKPWLIHSKKLGKLYRKAFK